jgi:ABC-2 type transport system ATP-binding protein
LLERRAAGCAILVSTHNLDEAERVADRIAFVRQRLLAVDRPAVLRRHLTTGRVMIRVGDSPERFLGVARTFDDKASIEGQLLVVSLADAEADTADLVSALVAAGARVTEVRPEIPALEDVYLHLIVDRGSAPPGVSGS